MSIQDPDDFGFKQNISAGERLFKSIIFAKALAFILHGECTNFIKDEKNYN